MSSSKGPRLFSGKWFSRLSKKEAVLAEKQITSAHQNMHTAKEHFELFVRLEDAVRQLRGFARVIRAERDPIRRTQWLAHLLQFDGEMPSSLRLGPRALREISRKDGFPILPDRMADNIQSRLDAMSSRVHPREKLQKLEQREMEEQARWRQLVQSRRMASRKGVKRLLRISSIAAARAKKKIKRLASRRKPAAH